MKAPVVVFLLAGFCGSGLALGGIYVLAGTGWALLAGGAICWTFAGFIRKGMTGG